MKAKKYSWFPTEGTLYENCFQEVVKRGNYAHITFDLWRTKYNFSPDGSKRLGGFYMEYLDRWKERALAKEAPFPRSGVMYSPTPIEHLDWMVLKEDTEYMVSNLWHMLMDENNLMEFVRTGEDDG